jgi:hypothetical protein
MAVTLQCQTKCCESDCLIKQWTGGSRAFWPCFRANATHELPDVWNTDYAPNRPPAAPKVDQPWSLTVQNMVSHEDAGVTDILLRVTDALIFWQCKPKKITYRNQNWKEWQMGQVNFRPVKNRTDVQLKTLIYNSSKLKQANFMLRGHRLLVQFGANSHNFYLLSKKRTSQ